MANAFDDLIPQQTSGGGNAFGDLIPQPVEGGAFEVPKPERYATLGEEFGRGTDITQAMFGGGIGAAGGLVGSDYLKRKGLEIAERNIAEAGEYPPSRVSRVEDIQTPSDFVDWAKYAAGQALPSMAAPLAGSVVGAGIGAATPFPGGAAVGGIAGAFMPSYLLNSGDAYLEYIEQGYDSPGAAVAAGLPMALLDVITPVKVAGRLLWKPAVEGAKRSIGRRIAAEAGKGTLREGATEAAQEAWKKTVGSALTGNELLTSENLSEIINEGAVGALAGGGISAAGGVFPDRAAVAPTEEDQAREAGIDATEAESQRVRDSLMQAEPEPAAPDVAPSAPDITETIPEAAFEPAGLLPPPAVRPPDPRGAFAASEPESPLELTDVAEEAPLELTEEYEPIPGIRAAMEGARERDRLARVQREAPSLFRASEPGGTIPQATAEKPAEILQPGDVDQAVQARPPAEPTPAQSEAGNYRQTHVNWHGLDIAIETPKGGIRRDLANDPPKWEVPNFPAHYGRIKRIEGADGDQVDIYLGPAAPTDADQVFVLDQISPDTKAFDEHKIFAGFTTADEALSTYSDAFPDGSGPSRAGTMSAMSVPEFKRWLDEGDTANALAYVSPADMAKAETPVETPAAAAEVPPASPVSDVTEPAAAPERPQAPQEGAEIPGGPVVEEKPTPEPAGVEAEGAAEAAPAVEEADWQPHYGRAETFVRGLEIGKSGRRKIGPPLLTRELGVTPDIARRLLDALAARGAVRKPVRGKGWYVTKSTKPRDAMAIIREMGGIKPDADLRAINTPISVLNRKGRTVHELREHFEEIGLLPAGSEDSAVYEIIRDETFGRHHYHPADADLVAREEAARTEELNAERRATYLADLKAVAEENGLALSDAELADLAETWYTSDLEPIDVLDDVIERAALQGIPEGETSQYIEAPAEDEIPFEQREEAGLSREAGGTGGTGGRLREAGGTAPQGEQPAQDSPALATEQTEQGEQGVIPGAEQISDRELAERRGAAPLRGTAAQKDADEGLFDTGARQQQDLQFSVTPATPFFSVLTQGVRDLKQKKAPGKQWAGMIRNLPAVKQEEIDWSGVLDWLGEQKGAVTKDELLGYLEANEVRVQEVTKGGIHPDAVGPDEIAGSEHGEEWAALNEKIDSFAYHPDGRPRPQSDLNLDELIALNKTMARREALHRRMVEETIARHPDRYSEEETKFATYTLPGGENYRELLLTLPERGGRVVKPSVAPEGWGTTEGGTAGIEVVDPGQDFTGGHFDEPNVLAHVRFDERTDADGNKVLFVQEIQSDWHQKGRKVGYKQAELPDAELRELEDLKARWGELTNDEIRRFNDLQDRSEARMAAVPDAPLKKTWHEMAFRRMVRYAAENGFDKLAWITGEQAADLYDLSRQVDAVRLEGDFDQSIEVSVARPGEGFEHMTSTTKDKLADVVGKDIADKALNQGQREFRGVDLKVGGEGMRGFYDKMVRSYASKFGKKFGAKVGVTEVETARGWPTKYHIMSRNDESHAIFDTEAEAVAALNDPSRGFGADYRVHASPDTKALTAAVHALPITDKMRESVLRGLPLFSLTERGRAALPGIKADLTQAAKMMNPDITVQFAAQIFAEGPGLLESGAETAERQPVAGYADKARNLIAVALDPAFDPEDTVFHEAWHTVEDMLTEQEQAILHKAFPGEGQQTPAEATARAFAKWATGEPTKALPAVRRIFAKIRRFFERLANMLRSRGFTAVEDIFEAGRNGGLAARKPIPGAQGGRQYAATRTGLPSDMFATWFGDSKVVDKDGKPLVVYHHGWFDEGEGDAPDTSSGMHFGTLNAAQERAFGKPIDDTILGLEVEQDEDTGQWFWRTDDGVDSFDYDERGFETEQEARHDGEQFARDQGESLDASAEDLGKITAAYLSISNPKRVGDQAGDWTAAIAQAKAEGHDGIVYRNKFEDIGSDSYLAFTPTQIKSVSNRGTYDPTDPRINYSVTPNRAAQNAAIDKVMDQGDQRTMAQRLTDLLGDIKARGLAEFKQGFLDQFDAIKALEVGTKGKLDDAARSAYKSALRTQNLSGVMGVALHHGPIRWNASEGRFEVMGKYKDGTAARGFLDIFNDIAHAGNLRLWKGYAIARRAERLIQEGREKVLSQADIDSLLALGREFPEFEAAFQEWQKFNGAMLDMAEAAGLIDPEQRAVWEKNDYVPFYRALDEKGILGPSTKSGLSGQTSGIKALRGSEEKIGDVIENMMLNMTHLVDASFKNIAMDRVVDLAESGGVVSPVTPGFRPVRIAADEAARALIKIGVDVDTMSAEEKRQWLRMFEMVPPKDPEVVSVRRDGKLQYYRVDDPLLLRSLVSLDPKNLNAVLKLMRGAKRVLTTMITADPAFMAANLFRDTLHSWVVTGYDFMPGLRTAKGFARALRMDPAIVEIMAAGAGSLGFYRTAPADVRKMLDAKMSRINRNTLIDGPRKAWEMYQRIGQASENANRLALHEHILKSGGTKAEAAHQAQDLMNFSMHGDWAAMRFLTNTVPFLNARVQGLYRLQRGAKANPAGFMLRGAVLMAASIALWWLNKDNQEYDELEDWDKDTYYHLFVGDGHYRMPKPFEVGAIFSTVPERLMGVLVKGELPEAANATGRMFRDTFALNPIPQLVRPIEEQRANRVTFTGRPIVGTAHEGVRPEAQYRPTSSATLIALADGLTQIDESSGDLVPDVARSPLRMEHFIRGYFGTLGMYLLNAVDVVTHEATGRPALPEKRWDQIPVIKRFVRDKPAYGTRWRTEFYDLNREVQSLYRTVRRFRQDGELERANSLLEKHRPRLQVRGAVNDIRKSVSGIRKRMQAIYNSKTMTPAGKRQQLDKLLERQNDVFRRTDTILQKIEELEAKAKTPKPRKSPPPRQTSLAPALKSGSVNRIRSAAQGATPADIAAAAGAAGLTNLQRLLQSMPARP